MRVPHGAIISRSELLRFTFNPFGVELALDRHLGIFYPLISSIRCTYQECTQYPKDLCITMRVPHGAIISRSELLRFTFNPFGVELSFLNSPTWPSNSVG